MQDILLKQYRVTCLQYIIVGCLVGILHGNYMAVFMPLFSGHGSKHDKGVIYAYNFFIQSGIPPGKAFSQIIVPETIYDVSDALIFYGITRLYHNKFMKNIDSKRFIKFITCIRIDYFYSFYFVF